MRACIYWCGVTLLVGLAGPALGQEKAPVPRPVPAATGVAATVNGQPISEKAVQTALRGVPAERQTEARADILNHFIDNMLLEQHLLQLRADLPKEEVDKSIAQLKEQVGKGPGQTFEKWLQAMNLTENELRTHITADLRWERFVNGQITEPVLRDYFTKNPAMFDGSMVRARHILLTPPANDAQAAQKMRAELEQLKQGIEQEVAKGLASPPATADAAAKEKARAQLIEVAFAKAATAKSACPSKEQGGDLGFFPRAGSMVEPFARAAFALKPFQMSEVVTSQFGLHVILATERKPGKETKFEEVKDAVREIYADRVLREGLLAQLRPKAKIVVNPPPKP